jgi:hypothetical protein
MGATTLPHCVSVAALASRAVTTPADPPWDRVWTIADVYDGPRAGIADLGGVPHLHQSEWDRDAGVDSDV